MLPHSGRQYENIFLEQTKLKINTLRETEDAYLDKILLDKFSNISFIAANFPRIFIDVNRSPLEIDENMLEKNNISQIFSKNSVKVNYGIGVFAKVNNLGKNIYDEKLSIDEIRRRLHFYYFPYHKKIRSFLSKTLDKHKVVIGLDCHSMSSNIVDKNLDVVLSNLDGIAADYEILHIMQAIFKANNYKVSINNPFKGGFISQKYGNPKKNIHIIQIELNKKLYLDEINFKLKEEGVKKIQKCFKMFLESIEKNFSIKT